MHCLWKANGRIILENSSAISHKIKHICALRPSNSTPRYLYKRNKNICIEGNEELLFNEHRVSTWYDEQVLEMDSGDGCTTL